MRLSRIKDLCYNVLYGTKNIFKWLPVIWKDRDWDSHYIYRAMLFKIRQTRKNIAKNQSYVGWEHDVKYMRISERLLERIIKDDYYDLMPWDKGRLITFTHPAYKEEKDRGLLFRILREKMDTWRD